MAAHRSGDLNPPLQPRRGAILDVLGVARISTDHQDEKSLADQEALYREYLNRYFGGEFNLRMIATRGKGERVDREELAELAGIIEAGEIDLVLTEDIGRIVRRVHAFLICESCEDAGVRLIAINDHIDTADDGWRFATFFASMRHEQYNKDTSQRIRRTQRNRFLQGGQLRTPLFCYFKPPGAKSDADLSKIPEMAPIVEEMVRRLEEGHSYSAVADWMNDNKVPCGRGAKTKSWKGAHVKNVIFNPILKGVRVHNRKTLIRVNKTGRRKAIPAPPEDLLQRPVPHLAFIEEGRYDRLIRRLTEKNAIYDVRRSRGSDPRAGRPKKRTRFPGQHVICGICNRPMVFGGNGRTTHLMCTGARMHKCWNGSTFDADVACRNISNAILDVIQELPEFEPTIRQLMQEEADQLLSGRQTQRRQLEQDAARNEREIQNLLAVLKTGGDVPFVQEELGRLQSERRRIAEELADLDAAPATGFELPSIDEIKTQARIELSALATTSYEFALLMRQLIPKLVAFPVRLCDGGYVETRLRFQLQFERFVPEGCRVPSVISHLKREIVVDTFEPVQRVLHREQVVALRASGMTERAAAAKLEISLPAAQGAAKLQRKMESLGLTDPYVPVLEPLNDFPRMCRHLHPRYRFDPLPPDEAA